MIEGSYYPVQAEALDEFRAFLPLPDASLRAVLYANINSESRCTFVLDSPDREPVDVTILVARILLLPMESGTIIAVEAWGTDAWDVYFFAAGLAPKDAVPPPIGRIDVKEMDVWLAAVIGGLSTMLSPDASQRMEVRRVRDCMVPTQAEEPMQAEEAPRRLRLQKEIAKTPAEGSPGVRLVSRAAWEKIFPPDKRLELYGLRPCIARGFADVLGTEIPMDRPITADEEASVDTMNWLRENSIAVPRHTVVFEDDVAQNGATRRP